MSKRVLMTLACILGLSILAGCTGVEPLFDECAGNNCRRENTGPDLTRVDAGPIIPVPIG